MRERLAKSPPAEHQKANLPAAAYERWLLNTLEAFEWADDGGLMAEVEVESDSGGET